MTTHRRWLAKIFCCLALCVISLATSWPLIVSSSKYFYHEDDAHHFNRTIEMSARRDLNPYYFNKPALHFYLRMPLVYAAAWYERRAGRLDSLRDIRTRDPYGLAGYAYTPSHPRILALLRLESAVWSALMAVATFLVVGLLRHSIRVAFAAALLVIASPEVVRNSYVIGVDTLMGLLCITTTAYAFWAQNRCTIQKLAICALLAGLACAAKYNAAPIVLVPLALWWLTERSFRGLIIVTALSAIGYLIGAPYTLLAWEEFIKGISYEAWHYGVAGHEGHTAGRGWPQALLYLRWVLSDGIGVSAAVLALLGGSWLSVYDRRAFILLLAFPLPYALLMIAQKTHFTRNMVVMVPYLATLAGVGIVALISTVRDRRWQHLLAVIIGLIALWPITQLSLNLIETNYRQHDSRDTAISWIAERSGVHTTSSTSTTPDIAVAGALQLPIRTFTMPGVDAFSTSKLTLAHLLQAGYEYIVIPSDLAHLDAELTEIVASIPGEPWPQRVPRNPAISIVRAKPHGIDKAARRAPSTLSFIAQSNQLRPKCPTQPGEDYCWITARVTELTFPALSGPGTFEIRSPWPDQTVTLTDTHGQLLASTKLTASEQWETLPIPASPGGQARTMLLTVTQVHSPQSRGVNQDTRRLGVAVRNGG
ncbi:MAG: hypothetical protein ACK5GN_11280 [Pseudomonadota bacterium]|jgi:hypothetical protein